MRALVTGGAGFIGSHLVDRFLRDGYEVRILDDLDGRVHRRCIPPYLAREAEFVKGNVTERVTWEQALKGVDVVSHQAAYQDYMLDFSRFMLVNAVSTALLYEVLVERRQQVRKVVVASSQAVYGEGQYTCPSHGLMLPEVRDQEQLKRGDWDVRCPRCHAPMRPELLQEEHPNPFNQYAVSKLAGEKIALGLGTLHQIPTVALRYSITQGPRQSLFNQYSGILRIFSTRALAKAPLIIYEDGQQTRDFVHVQDVVDANLCVVENTDADYHAFNVGSGRPVSVVKYAELMIQNVGSGAVTTIPGQYRVGDNRHSVSNIEKLQSLGWKPRRSLQQIQSDFLTWVDESGGIPAQIPEAYESMLASGVIRAVC